MAMMLALLLGGSPLRFPSVLHAEIIDRILAVVNGKILTLSDVEQELDFLLLAGGNPGILPPIRDVLAKLIDQHLIRQQMEQFPSVEVSPEEVRDQLAHLRQGHPDPKLWQQQMEHAGISLEKLEEHLQEQLKILKFLDDRFRPFAVVETAEIEEYYRRDFLPPLKAKNLTPPQLAEVEEKIRGLLIEQKINDQMEDWLKSLKEAASLQIME
jgi:hypothetical protein